MNPQVMISSTFFDLKQVRADLARFIGEYGCTPLISEWSSFPIDPNVDTIENCRRRVERDADILVLIVGGRYGYVDSRSSRSVTNLEYLAAKSKGIPIYGFIERRVLSAMPIWHANKDADFSGVIDDVRVFSFIEEVRDRDRVWTCEFDLAGDITSALRSQFSYLMLQGAQLVQRARDSRDFLILRELRGTPLRIALERPDAWEYRLFGELLTQEIDARSGLVEQKRLGMSLGPYEYLSRENFMAWQNARRAEILGMIESLRRVLDEELPKAIELEEEGNLEKIMSCARSLAALHQAALEWVLRVRRTVSDEMLSPVISSMYSWMDDFIEKIRTLGPLTLKAVEESLVKERSGDHSTVFISFSLILPGSDETIEALRNITLTLEEE